MLIGYILLFLCNGVVVYSNSGIYALVKGYDIPYHWYSSLLLIDPTSGETITTVVKDLKDIECELPNSITTTTNQTEIFVSCENIGAKGGIFLILDSSSGRVKRNFTDEKTFRDIFPKSMFFSGNSLAITVNKNSHSYVGLIDFDGSNSFQLQRSWIELGFVFYDASELRLMGNAIYWNPEEEEEEKREVAAGIQNPCSSDGNQISQLWYRWKNSTPASCSTNLDPSGKYATSTPGSFSKDNKSFLVAGFPYYKMFDSEPIAILTLDKQSGRIKDTFKLPLSLNKLQRPTEAWRNLGSYKENIFAFTLSKTGDSTDYLISVELVSGKVNIANLNTQGPQGRGIKNIWALSF